MPSKKNNWPQDYVDHPRPQVTCCECGKVERMQWNRTVEMQLRTRRLCYDCNFWEEKLALPGRAVVVAGCRYGIGSESPSDKAHRGFGGQAFLIKFFQGVPFDVFTTNLWHNGEIPKHYQDRMPNTATFGSQEDIAVHQCAKLLKEQK